MNVQLLSIEPTSQLSTYQIEVKIDDRLHQFTMTVKITPVLGHDLQIINGDASFLETFRFHPPVAREISRFVLDVYNHETVDLPATIREFKPEAIGSSGS
jgi:hypothetical protein